MLKSVLRYPGGKSKAVDKIIANIPDNIKEFREPMVGGGSVALVIKQLFPDIKVKINDLNYDLICFWKTLRDDSGKLIREKCKHLWLITYDDCTEIRRLFNFAYIYPWEMQYGMNNYKQDNAKKGKELFIANYKLSTML
jgi:site-specific DNA-adenine methylase